MYPASTAKWFLIRRPVRNPRVRLVCLPYAGGGAPIFHRWPDELPGDIEVCAAQLPARQSRLGEPGLTSVAVIAGRLAIALQQMAPAPVALFGHSFGALVAFELAHRLEQANRRPGHIIVAARRAPQIAATLPPISHLSDRELCQELQNRYGSGEMLLEHPELMAIALPSLRADLEANETYSYGANTPLLTAPLTALGGQKDSSLPAEHLTAWRSTTSGAYADHWVDAGHFFVDSHRPWVIERINQALATTATPGPGTIP